MMRQIPRRLLPHSITYEAYIESGTFGGQETYEEPITIGLVRVEKVKKRKIDSQLDNENTKLIVFVDAVNSKNVPNEFVVKSKVNFNGEELFVEEVKPLFEFSKLHHWELVIGYAKR